MSLLIQSLVDGILIGGVYAVIGLGLSLAYGVMDVVNWMHGQVLMVAMYLSFFLTKYAGMDPYLTAIATITCAAAAGFLIQKFTLTPLMQRSNVAWRDILLFTAGAGMALEALFNMIFGAEVKAVSTRYSGMLEVGTIMVSIPKLISFVIAILCCILLYIYLQRSEAGRALRATAQDRTTSQLMGVNANRVFAIAFAISLGLVGFAGALMIPVYSVNPYVGNSFSLKSFIIVAMGGKGDVFGALLAGVVIAVIEKVGAFFVGDNIAQVFIYILFIVILIVRPNGLLAKKKG